MTFFDTHDTQHNVVLGRMLGQKHVMAHLTFMNRYATLGLG